VYVARNPSAAGGKSQLVFAELCAGGGELDTASAEWVRDLRRIATLTSPNLSRIREVNVRGSDVVVIGEFIDGEKLAELWGSDEMPLDVALRVLVDVLSGVGALHNLRDAKQQPMRIAHGELSPFTVLFGLDGVARVLHSATRRVPHAAVDKGSIGHVAPEVHAGQAYDARADVFGVGVLLWEALSGKSLFAETDAATVVARVRSGDYAPASVPEKAPWAKPLVEVAAKALAASPDARWPTAAAMATEIRKAAGLKLAPASAAGAFAKSTLGDRVRVRRARLETCEPAPRSVSVVPGIDAPVADIVEIGSDPEPNVLVPESVASPTPSAALGGFVLDPHAAAALAARPPPPPPVRAPSLESPQRGVLSEEVPEFEVPISIVPLASEASKSAAPEKPKAVEPPVQPRTRQRLAIVLGSLCGVVVCLTTVGIWRAIHRNADSAPTPRVSALAPATPPRPVPPPDILAAPAPAPVPTPVPPPVPPAVSSPPPSTQQATKAPRNHAAPTATPPSRPKPPSKRTFDPNSL